VTEDSSNLKKPCIFPFKLQARSEDLNTCTNDGDPDGKYWCSTKTNRNGVHQKGHWGYCIDELALFVRSSDDDYDYDGEEGDCPIPDKPSPKPPKSIATTQKPPSIATTQKPPRSRATTQKPPSIATTPKPPRTRATTPKPPRTRATTPKPVDNSGSEGNGPVTKGDCIYTCLPNKGCQSRSTLGGSGKTQGSCFPQSFGGSCFGIPENCQNCNEVIDCEAGTGSGTGSGSNSSGTRVSNGQAQCVTTCTSNGGCSVRIVNGPPGKSSGSCFPPDFNGKCSGIPDLCARGNNISTQCGSPCEADTRNV
jgi:hypothetical protein